MSNCQEYNYTVVCQQGKLNPADNFSCHPVYLWVFFCVESSTPEQGMAEEHFNFVTGDAVPKSVTLTDIINATKSDVVLRVQRIPLLKIIGNLSSIDVLCNIKLNWKGMSGIRLENSTMSHFCWKPHGLWIFQIHKTPWFMNISNS